MIATCDGFYDVQSFAVICRDTTAVLDDCRVKESCPVGPDPCVFIPLNQQDDCADE